MSDSATTLEWNKHENSYWYLSMLAVPYSVVFAMIFEDWILGIAVGICLGMPFLFLGTNRSVRIDRQWLSYTNGKEECRVPVEEVVAITQEPMSGAMVFEFTDGSTDYVESAGDDQGVHEFVSAAQQYVS